MRVKEFIANQWVAYADYDNRRSLPHVMDGLKITQRKAMYAATKLPKGDKPIKVSQFAGKAAELTAYHHGDTSMISTIVGLAQDFPGSNNYPFLEKHGQFGTRLSNDPSAARYITTRLSKNWERFFKESDQDIVEYLYDDGEKIEPKYFIPVVPTILLNGCDGVGNGFKSSILNYDVADVVKAINEIIKSGKVSTPLIPKIVGWTGTVEKVDKQVIFKGVIKKINSTKLHITELPPSYDNEKYKKLLNKLIDEKFIKDYENRSTEDKWDWYIDCPRDTAAIDASVLLEKFGLVYKTSENFVCWGMDDSAPITFDSPEALVEYWYTHRLELYQKSLDNEIAKVKVEILTADLKMRFIKWCLKNDFRELTKAEFVERVQAEVKKMTPEYANKFVAMPMYKITTDEIETLRKEIEELVDRLDYLEQLKPIDVMKNNIKELK